MLFLINYSESKDRLVLTYNADGFYREVAVDPTQIYTIYGLANSTEMGVALTDLDLRILVWNSAMASYFGRPIEAVYGERLTEVLPELDLHVTNAIEREVVQGSLTFLQFGSIDFSASGREQLLGLHMMTIDEELKENRSSLTRQLQLGIRERSSANTKLLFVFTPVPGRDLATTAREATDLFSFREVDQTVLAMMRSSTEEETVQCFARLLHAISNMEFVSLLLFDEAGSDFFYRVHEGIPEEAVRGFRIALENVPNQEFLFAPQSFVVPTVRYYSQRHVRDGRTLSLPETKAHARKFGISAFQDMLFPAEVDSFLLLPIMYHSRVLGLAALSSRASMNRTLLDLEIDDRVVNTSKRLRVLSVFLVQLASALVNIRYHHEREAQQQRVFKEQQEKLTEQVELLKGQLEKERGYQLIGNAPKMQQVYELIRVTAREDVTVLLLGESGTGKELVARAVHFSSPRKTKPFVAVNCAALPEGLLESELFGHEQGAFTGADRRRLGKFEIADGGTLFLDEIGDITPATQAKLLRVLQERNFERIGGNNTISADVRLITATNRDLRQMVREGSFREDLFYRINVVPIALPPLRQRMEDLPLLVEHFVTEFKTRYRRLIKGVTRSVLERFYAHSWPGNVRELRNVIERAVVLCSSNEIDLDLLPELMRDQDIVPNPVESTHVLGTTFDAAVTAFKKRLVAHHLQQAEQNRTATAKSLGISRRHLYRVMQELGIEP
ncbi:MAG: sigma 54-interacting transcriptional regulator [Candidatus Schekmanbacteria bacterium]|nr:sigma 54-interacting transcriptional regulator [Candidatus Schekmanbacteria bacterium]